VGEALGLTEGLLLGEIEAEGDTLADGDKEADGDIEGLLLGEALGLLEGEILGEELGLLLGETEAEGDKDAEGDNDGEAEGDIEGETCHAPVVALPTFPSNALHLFVAPKFIHQGSDPERLRGGKLFKFPAFKLSYIL